LTYTAEVDVLLHSGLECQQVVKDQWERDQAGGDGNGTKRDAKEGPYAT